MKLVPHTGLSSRSMGMLALIDQGLVSGANFLIVVIVGRFCGLSELGQFSLAISVAVLFMTTLRSLLVTPYTVYSRRLDEQQQRILRGSTVHAFGLYLAGLIALCVGVWSFANMVFPSVSGVVLTGSIATVGLSVRDSPVVLRSRICDSGMRLRSTLRRQQACCFGLGFPTDVDC